MTNQEKEKILMLKAQGTSFGAIAETLGLSVNTVKSYYRREGKATMNCCKQCGKPVEQKPRTRQKLFCSDNCRAAWWKKHRAEINKKSAKDFTCACCGEEFKAYGERKYCSRPCYMKARFHHDD